MLNADRRSGRVRTVRELVAQFRGLSGTAKQKAILAELGLARCQPRGSGRPRRRARPRAARAAASAPCARRASRPRRKPLGSSARTTSSPDCRSATSVGPASAIASASTPTRWPPRIAEIGFAFDEDKLWDRLLLCGLNNSPALSDAGAFRELGVDGLGGLLGDQYAGHRRADHLLHAPDGRAAGLHRSRQVRGQPVGGETHGRFRQGPRRRRQEGHGEVAPSSAGARSVTPGPRAGVAMYSCDHVGSPSRTPPGR